MVQHGCRSVFNEFVGAPTTREAVITLKMTLVSTAKPPVSGATGTIAPAGFWHDFLHPPR
jgi:hypothetical protein